MLTLSSRLALIQAFAPTLSKYGHQWKRDATGKASRCQSPNKLKRAVSAKSTLKMVGDDNEDREPPKNEDQPGLMKKLLSPWEESNSGQGKTALERAGRLFLCCEHTLWSEKHMSICLLPHPFSFQFPAPDGLSVIPHVRPYVLQEIMFLTS